jgi:hypothetical protein
MGGVDWGGVPLMCEWLGVEDVDGLLHRLIVLKSSTREKPEDHGTGNPQH